MTTENDHISQLTNHSWHQPRPHLLGKNEFRFWAAILAMCFGFMTVASAIPTDGLVAYYPFNGNANDESGNGNNGTVFSATLTTDRFGNLGSAYSFDPAHGSYIVVPYSASLGVQNGLTMSAWILMDGGSDPSTPGRVLELRGYYDGTGHAGYAMLPHSNVNTERPFEVRWFNSDGNNNLSIHPTPPVPALVWKQIAFTADGVTGQGVFYIDGVAVAVNTSPDNGIITSADYGNNSLFIGAEPNRAGRWGGKIDDVAIYNRALSANEIESLFTGRPPDTGHVPDSGSYGLCFLLVVAGMVGFRHKYCTSNT